MWGLSHILRGVQVGSFSHPEGVFRWGLSHILRGCAGGVFLTFLGGVQVGSFSHS